MTLLCGPAGSGKTMLLSSWLRRGCDPPIVTPPAGVDGLGSYPATAGNDEARPSCAVNGGVRTRT